MADSPSSDVEAPGRVSTGELPRHETVADLVDEAHRRFSSLDDGATSTVYPALARVDPSLFGVAVVGVDGTMHTSGDVAVAFPIMSVAKPFVFALVRDALGHDGVAARVGVDATGLPFNSLAAIERRVGGHTNPMVNAGAIATTSLVGIGHEADARWGAIRRGLSRFAGRDLDVDTDVLDSARAANVRNRAITYLLDSVGGLGSGPDDALDLYTRQSCLSVTACDLAVMAATLADGGVNPVTGEQVVSAATARDTLVVMVTAGMYETSGEWLYRCGLPGKSGIGGGIITTSPGKGGLGVFSPPLDVAGNSVRGQATATWLARHLGLDIFASAPVG